ncbi:MAG: DNA topoisomerase IB [Burkholderiales bacterium]
MRDDPPTAADPLARRLAQEAGLVYVTDRSPGYRRERKGDGFVYRDADGTLVRDEDVLARIAKLAIPPAYEDVWIARNRRGHLQATGRDARGRKQYRYHADWRAVRDDEKFERMIAFGEALPKVRRRLAADLARDGLVRDKVLAAVVALLDTTRARVGNEEYARENKSYGLTTLRNRHVQFVRDGRARLAFRGKGGVEHEVVVDDRRLARIMRRCQQLPGQLLFQYVDDAGARHPVKSDLVNEYLKEVAGEGFTAKDFRTWAATLRAFALLAAQPLPEPVSERACKACEVAAIKAVAAELRNTPAVCRKSYINPAVFAGWRDGSLHAAHAGIGTRAPRRLETGLLRFLRERAKAQRRNADALRNPARVLRTSRRKLSAAAAPT